MSPDDAQGEGSLQFEPHPQGCVFTVHVKPAARREEVIGVRDGALHVAVHAPPEKGEAPCRNMA